ncbi:hypothetical protein PUN28_015286 [Cardiocondyla obscurior]|uniref:Uncharacterized protein n=1 Tax=Cardiocondyla obscurior TaxID=286306 RepID=A0AAW2F3A4_9HYME
MEMSATKTIDLPSQRVWTLRDRREGSIVPAPFPSSSNDGPPATCSAGVAGENVSAKELKKPGSASYREKKARLKGLSPYPLVRLTRHTPSRVTSLTPSIASITTADGQTDDVFVSGAEDSDTSMAVSDSSISSRKRERPLTTAEYIDLAAAKLRVIEIEQKMADLEERKSILNPVTSLPPKVRESAEEIVEHFLEKMKNAPTGDIVSQAFEDMEQVLRVSNVSKGLKGTLAKALKKAACRARAGVTIRSTKNLMSASECASLELHSLNKELEMARREIKNLREEVRALRNRASELP